MPLVNLKKMLADARQNHYAIPAFDVSNGEMIRAIIEVCEEERSPAIFMLLTVDLKGGGLRYLVDAIKSVSEIATVPVCIHLDHATRFEDIIRCIDAGVTSVMYDGSMLSLEENIANTRLVTQYAHPLGVTVEAELGHVTDAIGGLNETGNFIEGQLSVDDCLTRPAEVARFVTETDVDCLAVAIGTAHGVYVARPKLHLNRLEEIEAVSGCPLVLHGGSGTPDEDVKQAIALGITKINIYSEMLAAMNSGLKEKLNAIDNLSAWPVIVWDIARKRMRDVVRNKIRTFGSNGRA